VCKITVEAYEKIVIENLKQVREGSGWGVVLPLESKLQGRSVLCYRGNRCLCGRLNGTRVIRATKQRYFNVFTLKELFDMVNARDVPGFIRDIGIYRLIQINFLFTYFFTHFYIFVIV